MPLEKERGHKRREITQVSSRGVIVSRDLRWQRSLWPSEGFELSARSKSSSRLALGLLLDRGSKQSQRFPNWMKGGGGGKIRRFQVSPQPTEKPARTTTAKENRKLCALKPLTSKAKKFPPRKLESSVPQRRKSGEEAIRDEGGVRNKIVATMNSNRP